MVTAGNHCFGWFFNFPLVSAREGNREAFYPCLHLYHPRCVIHTLPFCPVFLMVCSKIISPFICFGSLRATWCGEKWPHLVWTLLHSRLNCSCWSWVSASQTQGCSDSFPCLSSTLNKISLLIYVFCPLSSLAYGCLMPPMPYFVSSNHSK